MAVVGGVGGCGVEAWRWWWCYVAEPASVGGLVISVATGVEWGGDGLLRHGAEICQWHPVAHPSRNMSMSSIARSDTPCTSEYD